MTSVVVWILIGMVSSYNGVQSAPPEHLFPTKNACEGVRQNIEDVARRSDLRCVQTTVLVRS